MILQTVYSFAFIIYLFYAQKIQTLQMLRQIEVTLRKVKTRQGGSSEPDS